MPPQHPFAPSDDRLTALRGPRSPQPYTACKMTALTADPACSRRAALDAAGVDKVALAQRDDPAVTEALAATAARLLERGALGNGEPLTESRIAIGAARTVQADAVRAQLAERGLTGITVDTADRLQGREFDVTLV